jgi:hypothetical protein
VLGSSAPVVRLLCSVLSLFCALVCAAGSSAVWLSGHPRRQGRGALVWLLPCGTGADCPHVTFLCIVSPAHARARATVPNSVRTVARCRSARPQGKTGRGKKRDAGRGKKRDACWCARRSGSGRALASAPRGQRHAAGAGSRPLVPNSPSPRRLWVEYNLSECLPVWPRAIHA